MKKNKPFETTKKPKTPYRLLMPVEWGGTLGYISRVHWGKIDRHGIKKMKPPFLLLANHGSMIDFPMAVKAVFPFRCNWVISIEEFVGREWLMRGIGGVYKRKFTSDMTFLRHLFDVLKKKRRPCIMYPEARFSLAGINERMSEALGQLAKTANVPVYTLISHGNFLYQPQWNKAHVNHIPVTADLKMVVSEEEVGTLSAEEIQRRIEESFVYDDYAWQAENKVPIFSRFRCENIERILYRCPVCEKEFAMRGKGNGITCGACGSHWDMNRYGVLHSENAKDTFTHVPDWYRWEREKTVEEVRSGEYLMEDTVRIERLVNCKVGFRTIGNVNMTHGKDGFVLDGTLDNGEHFHLHRPPETMESCHIEYDFHKKGVENRGAAIDLCNRTDTYFVFPIHKPDALTKIHFATEALYDIARENSKKGAAHKTQTEQA